MKLAKLLSNVSKELGLKCGGIELNKFNTNLGKRKPRSVKQTPLLIIIW